MDQFGPKTDPQQGGAFAQEVASQLTAATMAIVKPNRRQ
jgi:hypothetical protein